MTDMVVVPKEVIDDAIRQLSWFRCRALKDGKRPQADWIETFRKKLQWCAFSARASAPPVGDVREKVLEALKGALEWDKARGYRMPYRVRDPIYAALDALLSQPGEG